MNNLICFCFGYSAEDILVDFKKNGRSTIMEKIMSEKSLGSCRWGKLNPKGR